MKDNSFNLIIGYLQEELTKDEKDAFYVWVNNDPENKKLFFEIKAIYDAGKTDYDNFFNPESSWQHLLNKKKKSSSGAYIILQRIGLYAAAVFMAVLLTSLFFLLTDNETSNVATRYVGGDGLEADIVVLPDGTHVSLGSKTTFYYDNDYGKKERVVYLEGEAYFEVAKQKQKPFIVKVNEQKIEALGTKFNIMAYLKDSVFTTTLLEGSIRLMTENLSNSTILKPNQQYVYNRNTRVIKINRVDAEQFISWTAGYYYFSEQTLKAILNRLSHVYGVRFIVNSETINNTVFTGTFYRGQSIKDIMEIVNMSIPIHYEIDSHQVTITE